MHKSLLLLFTILATTSVYATNSVRVLTYNIFQGGRNTDNSRDLGRVADVIKLFDADVVGLQEVDRNTTRCGKRDIPAELAQLTGLRHVAYGAAMPYQGGQYGNAILSRYPLQVVTNIVLPTRQGSEPRAALVVTLAAPTPILLVNTHLSVESAEDRRMQVNALREFLTRQGNVPVVVTGDFNDTPDSDVISALRAAGTDASAASRPDLTFPSHQPDRQIDFIWLAPAEAWHTAGVRTGAEQAGDDTAHQTLLQRASDHLPLFGEFRLSAEKPR